MSTLKFTKDGSVDTRDLARRINATSSGCVESMLCEALRAVWADGYTLGYADGHHGDDPNKRANPYSDGETK